MRASSIILPIILIINGIIGQAHAQDKLIKTKLGEGITMKIPSSFFPMNEADMWQRMTSYRKSIALYTDIDRLVDLGVNRSYSIWREGDYQMMFEVYKSSILQLFDEVDFIKAEIVNIKKHPFVVFEFESKMNPDESLGSGSVTKYTYIQYTIIDGQTLVFDFSCPLYQKERWQSLANEIMNSVTFK